MVHDTLTADELITYIDDFKFDRVEFVELNLAERNMVTDALQHWIEKV